MVSERPEKQGKAKIKIVQLPVMGTDDWDTLIDGKNAIQTEGDGEVRLTRKTKVRFPYYKSASHGTKTLLQMGHILSGSAGGKSKLYMQDEPNGLFRDILPLGCDSPSIFCWDTFERYGDIIFYYIDQTNRGKHNLYVNGTIYPDVDTGSLTDEYTLLRVGDGTRRVGDKLCIRDKNTFRVVKMNDDKTLSLISKTVLPTGHKGMRYELNEQGELLLRREDLIAIDSKGTHATIQSRNSEFRLMVNERPLDIPETIGDRDQIKKLDFVDDNTITIRYTVTGKQEAMAYITVSSLGDIAEYNKKDIFNGLSNTHEDTI